MNNIYIARMRRCGECTYFTKRDTGRTDANGICDNMPEYENPYTSSESNCGRWEAI